MRLIDLSLPLDANTLVYPGDPPTKIEPAGTIEKDGFADSYLSFGTHLGTHIDAPAHVLSDGRTLDQFSLDHFVGPGHYIDVRSKTFDLEYIKQQGVQKGEIVLFRSGLSDKYQEPGYFEDYPVMPAEVANYLVECGVKMVGVDMCSVDHEQPTIHQILLGHGVLIIENLTNLAALAGATFRVYALPLKFALDGSPARVIAQIEEQPA